MTDVTAAGAHVKAPAGGPPRAPARGGRPGHISGRPLWLMAPGAALLLLVVVVPLALAVWIGLVDLDQFTLRDWLGAPFIGFANYLEALQTGGLLHSIWVSTAFSVLTTVVIAPIGILAALTVHDPFRGRAIVRSVYLIPYVIPSFVTAVVWRLILQPDGALNSMLGVVGVEGGNWLIGPMAFWSLVLVDTWAAWAFVYLMTLAGLQTIPQDVYEAAAVDGTNWWQKLRFVVLPQLRGPLTLALLLSTLHHFNNFTLPFVLFGSPAPTEVNVLPLNIYTTSFQTFRFGLGAAMSILALVVLVIPAILYLRAVRLESGTGEER
ncbi:sugar ABC transporter permease [Pseudonocardia aurantiaca]|uniref:Carbohydrate ABC transporter permease n=1 Tax=Pseudonocardia aurantiaca TaxID=75290 RepID=A0ABW4FH63_9PSEU